MNVPGKVALVTGASKGIGAATAKRLASEGATVVVNYNKDATGAKKVVEEIKADDGMAVAIQADISNSEQLSAMFQKIKDQYVSIDILVNNVGIIDGKDGTRNADTFRKTFEVNVFAQVEVTDAALNLMNEGRIVFISSVHGGIGRGNPGVAAYSASKAAIDSYIKNLAKEIAPKILVNGIAPGRTLTPMWGEMSSKEKEELASGHFTNEWTKPEEIADGVAFLIKNDSMCGEIISIDGGMSIKTLG